MVIEFYVECLESVEVSVYFNNISKILERCFIGLRLSIENV